MNAKEERQQGTERFGRTCSRCGEPARIIRGTYPFKELGLRNVVLQGIELVRCDTCGNEDPRIPRLSELMRVLALAVIRKPYRLSGEELRFLRKYLGLTAEKFAGILRVDRTTVSKWENGEDSVGEQSDLLIRLIAQALGKGLKGDLEATIWQFPQIRNSCGRIRIEVDARTFEYTYG